MTTQKQYWFVAAALVITMILMSASNAKYRNEFKSIVDSWVESDARSAMTEVRVVQKARRDLKKGDTQTAEKYLQIRYDSQVKTLKRVAECDGIAEELCERASEVLAMIEECESLEDNEKAEEE
ncbi:MAG: hypothetical protein KJO72_07230 [Gammaproteobacteria bacterium]|nr:hypothetical protein [Gammaproteobacteria bacterium]